jgi:hypothetical protein
LKEIFEDTKGAIKRRKSKKDRQYNRKETEWQRTIYKTLHRKQKIEKEVWAVPAPLLTPVVLLLLQTTGDMSWMRKGPDCDYIKWNLSVVICDTDTP